MSKNFSRLFNSIMTTHKSRTIKLLFFLCLIIALPIIVNAPRDRQTISQHAQIARPGLYPVYGIDATVLDGLDPSWTSKINYGTPNDLNLSNQVPVYQGTNSIAFTITAPWTELMFIAPQTFNISPYNYLTFYARAGEPGQLLAVNLLNANNQPILTNDLPMSDYGGYPITSMWTVYNIPIAAFNLPDKNIKGIMFKDRQGGRTSLDAPPIYIDEINFSVETGENIGPGPGAPQGDIPTRIPKPVMPYYPDISPWVFIIPAIIIGLAIIFQ